MAGSTVTALAKAARLSDLDVAYLKAKGYDTVAILARAARDDDEFLTRILKPFIAGEKIDETVHKASGDRNLMEARFLVLFDDAKNVRKAELAAAATPQLFNSLAPKSTAGAGVVLDPKDYQKQIDAWEKFWTPSRKFPQRFIQGADHVLQRLLDERHTSRFYTPLHLSEVIQSRAHNSDGSINLARIEKPRRDERVILTASGVEIEQATPDPLADSDRWKIYDALIANSWALRWAGYASDDVARTWTDWLVSELRAPGSTDLFKLFYLTCSWRVAFAMRGGKTFDEEVLEIMKDDEWVRKAKQQIKDKSQAVPATTSKAAPSAPDMRPPRGPPPQRALANRSRSRSKKGDNLQVRNGNSSFRLARSRSRNGTFLCKLFQSGHCKNKGKGDRGAGKECRYSHECGGCGKRGCVGQLACKSKKR